MPNKLTVFSNSGAADMLTPPIRLHLQLDPVNEYPLPGGDVMQITWVGKQDLTVEAAKNLIRELTQAVATAEVDSRVTVEVGKNIGDT